MHLQRCQPPNRIHGPCLDPAGNSLDEMTLNQSGEFEVSFFHFVRNEDGAVVVHGIYIYIYVYE